MIRRPPRSTQSRSSAASDVYKRQGGGVLDDLGHRRIEDTGPGVGVRQDVMDLVGHVAVVHIDRGASELERREERLEVLRGVEEINRDAVPGLETLTIKVRRQAAGPIVEL